MSASLSEKSGDVIGIRERYDFACDQLPFACRKAFGLAEERLIGDVERRDSAAALKQLQEPGLNANARHGKLLQYAVSGQLKDLVKALLAYGANPNADFSIMANATNGKDSDILMLLLHHGLDPNLGAFLHDAVDRGNLLLAETLIRKGARVNEDENVGRGTPLMTAAEDNDRKIVKLLLENGADPTITAKFHDPPLRSTTDAEIKRMLRIALSECKAGTRKCEEQP
jgi:ankyrin repeat protein